MALPMAVPIKSLLPILRLCLSEIGVSRSELLIAWRNIETKWWQRFQINHNNPLFKRN
jgi:hypothetical protein